MINTHIHKRASYDAYLKLQVTRFEIPLKEHARLPLGGTIVNDGFLIRVDREKVKESTAKQEYRRNWKK